MSDTEDQFADLPTRAPIAMTRSPREPSRLLLRVTIYVAVLQTLCAFAIDNAAWVIVPSLVGLVSLAFWLYLPSAVADAVLCILTLATSRKNYRTFAIVALSLVLLQFALVVYYFVRFATEPAPWDF